MPDLARVANTMRDCIMIKGNSLIDGGQGSHTAKIFCIEILLDVSCESYFQRKIVCISTADMII